MGENTAIQWANHTWSPWIGCSHAHVGCDNCYAEAMAGRFVVTWGPHGTRRKTSEAYWRKPLSWEREASATGQRPRIFPSLCDPFEDWPRFIGDPAGLQLTIRATPDLPATRPGGRRLATMDDLRRSMFALIDQTPHLDWLLLTKRPDAIPRMWPPRIVANDFPVLGWPKLGFPSNVLAAHARQAQINHGQSLEQLRARGGLSAQEMLAVLEDRKYQPIEGGEAAAVDLLCTHRAEEMKRRQNVWLIYSASDQETLEAGLPHLLGCRDLVPVLGLSLEPLLGPVDLRGASVDWVIVGGESGPHARPCNIDWIRSIVKQCAAAGVPCFVKQLGANYYDEVNGVCGHSTRWPYDILPAGPAYRLRDCKGGDMSEWPEDLRVREIPSGRQDDGKD